MASACTVVLANDATTGGFGSGASGGFRAVKASSCILMTIAVAAAVVLVLAGVFVIREYSLSASYEPASCRVDNITYLPRDGVCLHCATVAAGEKSGKVSSGSQGAACVTVQFPCLAVSVAYYRPGGTSGGAEHRALLHSDSLQAAGAHNQCSHSVCLRTREENQRAVEQFADQWRGKVHTTSIADQSPASSPKYAVEAPSGAADTERFSCYYDTADPSRVIARKTYTRFDVVHCVLWPSLALIVSATVFLYLEARRTHLTCCGRRSVADDDGVASCGSSSTRDEKAALKVSLQTGRPPTTRGTSPRPQTASNGVTTKHEKITTNNGPSTAIEPCFHRPDASLSTYYQGGGHILTADDRRSFVGGESSLTRLDVIVGGQSPHQSWSASRGVVSRGMSDDKRPQQQLWTHNATSNGGISQSQSSRQQQQQQQQNMLLQPEDTSRESDRRHRLSRSALSLVRPQHDETDTDETTTIERLRSDDSSAKRIVDMELRVQAGDGGRPARNPAESRKTSSPGLPTSVCLGQRGRCSSDYQLANV